MENAHQACQAQNNFVASGTPDTKKNVASPRDYDMIATAATIKDLLDLKLKRSVFVKQIKQHHEDEQGLKVTDFPLLCPTTPHAMALFNASIAMEAKLFPDRKEDNDNRLEATFQKRLETKAFCNVDVEKVLEEKAWIDFFKSL